MRRVFTASIVGVLLGSSLMLAQGPPQPPLSERELVDILKSKDRSAQAAALVEQRGVTFELNPDIEKQLRKAKASDAVIEAVKNGSPKARTERAVATGSLVATPEEEQEFKAISDELNPDVAIQLSAEFAQKYPKSPLLTYVHAISAAKYEEKGDVANVIAQSEKSLALKADNLMTLLIITNVLPLPQSLNLGNLDGKLSQAERYAGQALEIIGSLTAQPSETPDQFSTRKSSYLRDLHSSLGMVHFQRAMQSLGDPDPEELGKAEAEYDTAVAISSDPKASDYYRLGEVRGHLKKHDAAIESFNRCIELDNGSGIKAYATESIKSIQKKKGQAPAKP